MKIFRSTVEEIEEIGPYIQIRLPKVKQTKTFSCGAAALRSVCELFGVGPESERDFIKACKTSKKTGTRPRDLIRAAREFGLSVRPQSGMSIENLKKYLDMGRPVICCLQAWCGCEIEDRDKAYKDRASGHYVVACGSDHSLIYFEDPMMEDSRGFLPYEDFKKRWHDEDYDGNVYKQYGIVLWKSSGTELCNEHVPQAKKIP